MSYMYVTCKWGLAGPEAPAKKVFSVRFGGFAAKTNRKHMIWTRLRPAQPREGGTLYAVPYPDATWVMQP